MWNSEQLCVILAVFILVIYSLPSCQLRAQYRELRQENHNALS